MSPVIRARAPLAFAFAACALVAACDHDLGTFRFRLPTKLMRLDTTRHVWASAPARVPTAACAETTDCCLSMRDVAIECAAARPLCGSDGHCAGRLTLERALPMFLLREIPDLALVGSGRLSSLRVAQVNMRVQREQGEPIGLENIRVLFGPFRAQTADHAEAKLVARHAALGPGASAAAAELVGSPLGQLAQRPGDPVTLIAAADAPLVAGSPVPRGELVLALDIDFETELGP